MKSEARSARRRSRRAALQALYSADVHERATSAPGSPLAALDSLAEHFELAPGARAFAEELVKGVAAERPVLDARLVAVARNWRLERMAHVDRNLLRLAAWEILFGGTPPAVAIDEAVELAREFGDDASPRFVNGVLDALVRSGADAVAPENAKAHGPSESAEARGPSESAGAPDPRESARARDPRESARARDPRRGA